MNSKYLNSDFMNSDYMNADAIFRAVFYNFSGIPDFKDNRGKFCKKW
jgi:hypothetical protein